MPPLLQCWYNPMILYKSANVLVSNRLQDGKDPPEAQVELVLKNWLCVLEDKMEEISSHWGFAVKTNSEWIDYYIKEYN